MPSLEQKLRKRHRSLTKKIKKIEQKLASPNKRIINYIHHKKLLKGHEFALVDSCGGHCDKWTYSDHISKCDCGSSYYLYDHDSINCLIDVSIRDMVPLYKVIKV